MFEAGDFVVYGNKGVCQILKIGPVDIPGVSREKLYYTMTQVYLKGSTIFTPVDSDKIVMRKILTKKEADELIGEVQDIKIDWIENDKERERQYTEALRVGDSKCLFKMIIALYRRKEKRIADGKKATSTDEKFFRAAEDILYGELAIPLSISKDEVRDYIMNSVMN